MPATEPFKARPARRGRPARVPETKSAMAKVFEMQISLLRMLVADSPDPAVARAARTRLREVKQAAANPLLNLTDLAAHFGVSRPFIYQARREGYQFTHGAFTEAAHFKDWLSRRSTPPRLEPAPSPAPAGTPDGR